MRTGPADFSAQELTSQIQYRLVEELSASERRYRELVEGIREVVFKCDNDGRLLFLNNAWTKILGYAVADSVGRYMREFLHEDDQEKVMAMIIGGKTCTNTAESIEVRYRRSDGEHVWVVLAVQMAETAGKIGSLYDIDERKRAQQALLRMNRDLSSEIEERKRIQETLIKVEKLAVVGETSGRVAHEVLNPVTSILARVEHDLSKWVDFAELLDNSRKIIGDWRVHHDTGTLAGYLATVNDEGARYSDEDFGLLCRLLDRQAAFGEQRAEDLRFMHKQLKRIIKIVNNLRNSARTQRSPEILHIGTAAAEAYEIMADSLAKRRIAAEQRIPADLPYVIADENDMIQVFTNLFRNAMQSIEAKQQGGGTIETVGTLCGNSIEIRVIDDGKGIPSADQSAIFDFGFSTKSRNEGTGMGLGISRRFVRESGGDLILEGSSVGVGATFLITLPVARDC